MGQSQPLRPMALIVEDDEQQRDLVATLFEETEFEVVSCEKRRSGAFGDGNPRQARLGHLHGCLAVGILDVSIWPAWPRTAGPTSSVLVTSGAGGERLDYLPKGAVFMQKPWRALDVLVEAERAHAA